MWFSDCTLGHGLIVFSPRARGPRVLVMHTVEPTIPSGIPPDIFRVYHPLYRIRPAIGAHFAFPLPFPRLTVPSHFTLFGDSSMDSSVALWPFTTRMAAGARSSILHTLDVAGILSMVFLVVMTVVRRYQAKRSRLPLPPSPPKPMGKDHLAIMPKNGMSYVAYDQWMKDLSELRFLSFVCAG